LRTETASVNRDAAAVPVINSTIAVPAMVVLEPDVVVVVAVMEVEGWQLPHFPDNLKPRNHPP